VLALRTRRSCRATRELAVAKLRVIDMRLRELRHLRLEIAVAGRRQRHNTEMSACPDREENKP